MKAKSKKKSKPADVDKLTPEQREHKNEVRRAWRLRVKEETGLSDGQVYYRANKEKLNEKRMTRYWESPEESRVWNSGMIFAPGQTIEKMRAEQGNTCAICPRSLEGKRKMQVDHDHRTGYVRALLCQGCNPGLGNMKENLDTMRAAIAYLEKHRTLQTPYYDVC